MKPNMMLSRFFLICSFIVLTACGSSSEEAPSPETEVLSDVSYTLNGQAFGVSEPIQLRYGDNLIEVTGDGRFTFPEKFKTGDSVALSIVTQPKHYSCSIQNADLTFDSSSISNVEIRCLRDAYSIGGGAFGVDGHVTLALGDERLALSGDGPFTFPSLLKKGSEYSVSVVDTSVGLVCDARLASGVVEGQITSIRILCGDGTEPQLPQYFLAGKAFLIDPDDGSLQPILDAFPLELLEEDGSQTQRLTVSGNDFVLPDLFEAGESFNIQIASHPEGYVCDINSEKGSFNGGDINNVRVLCEEGYSLAGSIRDLNGSLSFKLGNQVVNVSSTNPDEFVEYAFDKKFVAANAISFEFLQQPLDQECSVSAQPWASDIGLDSDRTDINISCEYIAHLLGGAVSGLDGEVRIAVEEQELTLTEDGDFVFARRVSETDELNVRVVSDPVQQTCSLTPVELELMEDKASALSVSCRDTFYDLQVPINGLSGFPVQLRLESSRIEPVEFSTDSSFPGVLTLPKGAQVELSIIGGVPSGSICELSASSVSMFSDQTVELNCRPAAYRVSAIVSGLVGELELGLGDQATRTLISDGAVEFGEQIEDGASAQVLIVTQPDHQRCEVNPETLVVTQGSVSVEVACRYSHHLVSGAVEGLSGEITLRSGEQTVVVTGNQPFAFADRVSEDAPLNISVDAVAEHHRCSVSGNGIALTGDYDQVLVSCVYGSSIAGSISTPDNLTADSDLNDERAPEIPNNLFAEAQRINGFAAVQGFVSASVTSIDQGRFAERTDKEDIFFTHLEKGQTLALRGTPTDKDVTLFDLDLELFKESEAQDGLANIVPVGKSYNAGAQEQIVVPETGRYYIRVLAEEGAGTYALETQAVSSSSLNSSGVYDFAEQQAILNLDTSDKRFRTYAASLGGSVDHFDLSRASLLSLDSEHLPDLSPADLELAAINPEGMEDLLTLRRIKELSLRADVRIVEPNYVRQPMLLSGEPLQQYQWEHERINLPQAWDITTGGPAALSDGTFRDVIVAVLDTGIQSNQEEFAGKLVQGYDFVSDPGLAIDGTGIDDDPEEIAGVMQPSDAWHGTSVASIIGANSQNGLGMAGVSWGGKIMPVQVANKEGLYSDYDIANALRYVSGLDNVSGQTPSQRADIVNMSFGGEAFSMSMLEAIDAARAEGLILVAASGNEYSYVVNYPASNHGVISVGATDYQGSKVAYSTYNEFVDVVAPAGISDLSDGATDLDRDGYLDAIMRVDGSPTGLTLPDGKPSGYSPSQGTSFSAPVVSGVLALMKSVYPDLTPAHVDSLLASGALTNDIGPDGRDPYFGHGMIDAFKAVSIAQQIAADPANIAPKVPDYRVSDREFRFTQSAIAGELSISNSTEYGSIASVTSDQSWLSIEQVIEELDPADEPELPSVTRYRLSVDTRNLFDTAYFATISVTDSEGTVQYIGVSLELQNIDGQQFDAPMYVQFYNGNGLANQVDAQAVGQGIWSYQVEGLLPGAYEVVVQSDLDKNGQLCSVGELCGIESIDLDLEDVSGLDVVTELQIVEQP
ncbi:hypothetical protein A3742_12550 [Oleiphilus sp. HI0071]|nr:hypothetical protein A3737_13610 [Oleiphilus sp. HI0065]KZY80681.1 hypothetical protein A3742_12550 [Oleiphilus sp. HI0071]KZZ16230.1 hypothetical protein A3750_10650 [Oleiphilus sp. HI0079]KZZ18117.1 hypothetical protein A3751_09360 [Oleiphilus sp. HI0080]KZZ55034.1 hypothetical protein A3760_08620 [Oleiphilus sp. HI0122]KZZ78635.1 hypothetical protein A3767_12495 [Oleiphilus sp. HI0133]